MRFIIVYPQNEKFITVFREGDLRESKVKQLVEGNLLEPQEVIIDWIENGIIPKHTTR